MAVIGGFRSDLSIARMLETFPQVVAHQRKLELKTYSAGFISVEYVGKYTNYQPMSSSHSPVAIDAREVTKIINSSRPTYFPLWRSVVTVTEFIAESGRGCTRKWAGQ